MNSSGSLSIIVDTGVEEPMKITSDRQEESVKKLQAIMETETLSTMPEETVLSTTSQENNNHSESNKCEQINSSLVMSNELLIEEHVHQNDQTQMPGMKHCTMHGYTYPNCHLTV